MDKAALAKTNPYAALDMEMAKATARLEAIVPKHVDPRRVIQLALSCARKDAKLLECTTSSMMIATASIAALGLEVGTALQHAYLVPRKNNRKKKGGGWEEVYEATAIIGYRGFVLLAHDSEGIDCQAETVHELDLFRERSGLVPMLEHEQSEAPDPGKLRGAYAVWELRSGRRRHLWWPMARLLEHRKRFAPRKMFDKDGQRYPKGEEPFTGPWEDHIGAMCQKTVVRAAAKLWPLSSDRMRAALTIDDAGEQGRALAFIPGVKPEAVRLLAVEMGENPETFDADQGDAPPIEMVDDREPGSDG